MQKNKEKIAFFDFCGTLVPFQSAPRYIDFVLANYAHRGAKLKKRFHTLLVKLHMPHRIERFSGGLFSQKEMELRPLRGYKQDVLEQAAKKFYFEVIKPNLIPEVLGKLQELQQSGYRIVLVSAGFGIYLKYFASDFGIAPIDLFSSNIEICHGRATGKLDGLDCVGQNKIKLLEQKFNRDEIESIAFSDSPSDAPLWQWSNNGVAICQIPTWHMQCGVDVLYYNLKK